MGNKTRAASKASDKENFEKELVRLKNLANGRTYEHWERANAAYFFCFPGIDIMPEKFSSEDSVAGCIAAVNYFVQHIDYANNSHPVKRKFRNKEERLKAFNARYPLKEKEVS